VVEWGDLRSDGGGGRDREVEIIQVGSVLDRNEGGGMGQ